MKKKLFKFLRNVTSPIFNSVDYWENRYKTGGNSGSGSYGKLAEFKARILNNFVAENRINSVIEFGCGDGNQISLSNYPMYLGLDVSPTAIEICKKKFINDTKKSFFLYHDKCFVDNHSVFKCELALSLDVIYHLVEKDIYENYLSHLFQSASRFVIIYSSNCNPIQNKVGSHEFHRIFTVDVERIAPEWELISEIENELKPSNWSDEEGSIANFFIYKKK